MVPAVALRALAAPPVLPTAQGHTAKLRTAVVVPTAEKTPELSPEAEAATKLQRDPETGVYRPR